MMMAYVNIYGHPIAKLPIKYILSQLDEKVWGDFSPIDVIENLHLKKYKDDVERIQKADLTYPVIVTDNYKLVDGYHRAAKAYLESKRYINAYILGSDLMNKFIINTEMDFVRVHSHTGVHEILEIWSKRFCYKRNGTNVKT